MGEIGFCDIWRAGERTMPAFLEPKLKNGPTTPMERRPDPQLGSRSGLLGWVPGLSGANVSPEWVEDHGSREGLRGGLNHTRLQPTPYRSIPAGGGEGVLWVAHLLRGTGTVVDHIAVEISADPGA